MNGSDLARAAAAQIARLFFLAFAAGCLATGALFAAYHGIAWLIQHVAFV